MTPSPLKYVDDNIFSLLSDERVIGFYLYDNLNQEVERIKGLLVDPETFQPLYLVIKIGGMMFTEGKLVLVPRVLYEPDGLGRARVDWTRESLQQGPSIQNIQHLTREEEQVILSYFDLEPYWDIEQETADSEGKESVAGVED